MNLNGRTPAGTAFPVAPPSEEAFRSYVLAGVCPFCGLGPYKVLAGHTTKAHATDRKQLRELAGLPYSTSITSEDFHAEKSARSKEQYEEGRSFGPGNRGPKPGTRRTLSPAAKKLNAEKGRRAREKDPDLMRRASAASSAKTLERLRPEYERVIRTYEQVMAETGQAYGAVKETARRLGWPEPRTLRRIEAAEKLGMASGPRMTRGREEKRRCPVCDTEFTVTRSKGWNNETCGVACGNVLTGRRQTKPPRTAVCMVCNEEFTYKRPGTTPRKVCDKAECRRAGSGRKPGPPKVATCSVCGQEFSYKRPGTAPRLVCDNPECRRESRRRSTARRWQGETG